MQYFLSSHDCLNKDAHAAHGPDPLICRSSSHEIAYGGQMHARSVDIEPK